MQKLLLYLSLFVLIFTFPAYALETSLYIDASGSMEGFYNKKDSINSFVNKISKVLNIQPYVFLSNKPNKGNSNYKDKNFLDILNYSEFISKIQKNSYDYHYGLYTNLDLLLEKSRNEDKISFIITDNIQDTADISTERFYQSLSNYAKYIYLAPIVLDFQGDVILEGQNRLQNNINIKGVKKIINQKNSQRITYEGKRTLILYALLFDEAYKEKYIEKVNSLNNINLEPVLVKPIENTNFQLKTDNTNNLKKVIDNYNKNCSKNIEVDYKNLMQIKNNNSFYSIVPTIDDKNKKFELEKSNYFDFYFSIISKINNIEIGAKNKNKCKSNIEFLCSNFKLLVDNSDKKILESKIKGTITPPTVIGALKENKKDFVSYHLARIDFDSIKYNYTITDYLLLRPFKKSYFEIDFDVSIKIPKNSISLEENYKNKYFSSDIKQLDKIYSPVDIVEFLIKKDIDINFHVKTESNNIFSFHHSLKSKIISLITLFSILLLLIYLFLLNKKDLIRYELIDNKKFVYDGKYSFIKPLIVKHKGEEIMKIYKNIFLKPIAKVNNDYIIDEKLTKKTLHKNDKFKVLKNKELFTEFIVK
ncbi:MAG: hypothetical protein KatS3mg068_1361 [Candidatus Sericytochromatia bacterium]|nr:MAG: hypothetical protein KatS3mg068_1361 [Candidatus Sericytochromatia bacterium]